MRRRASSPHWLQRSLYLLFYFYRCTLFESSTIFEFTRKNFMYYVLKTRPPQPNPARRSICPAPAFKAGLAPPPSPMLTRFLVVDSPPLVPFPCPRPGPGIPRRPSSLTRPLPLVLGRDVRCSLVPSPPISGRSRNASSRPQLNLLPTLASILCIICCRRE